MRASSGPRRVPEGPHLRERPSHGLGELTGVTVTVAIHWWRRNVVLSIVTGTAACLLMTNWGLPV